jgi:hypothetical protein
MNHAELIKKLGGNSKIAAMLGIKPPSISYWRRKGIPELRLRQLKDLAPKAFDEVHTQDTPPAST